ncbi:hypothetical protein ANANG_G00116950 [Anguilla anguilla]|uniref:Uncharacterized protein n=1 Tax=Anguilla anguilla TaxID=7936 RepID=A0A9D3MDL7_ANGAN|nr:hypothetical protein ANANG_G00116950 [Anguilla anguilla]
MASEVKLKDDVLINALSEFVNIGRSILKEAEDECSKGLPQEKVSQTITSMFGLSVAAAGFFNSLSVKNRTEAEELWKTAYHQAEVRDMVEDLLQLERQDTKQQTTDTLLGQGPRAGNLPEDMVFINARTGGTVNLAQYLGKGENLLLFLLRHLA